ncbi:MAG: type I restriction endonuclease subunit R, partial [Burkholderiales bacterium]
GVFDKERFIDLLAHFQAYEVKEGAAKAKKLAGYHQFHAVRKAVQHTIRAANHDGDRKAGVIWHTQGSGKSFTMALYASRLERAPELGNPTVVVVTDRNDLDDQLFDTFQEHPDLFVSKPEPAEDRADLREKLKRVSGGIVFTTMQRFALLDDEKEYPQLTDRRNVIVIADEAHRTQYGFGSKVSVNKDGAKLASGGYAQHLRNALPFATFIGFTGTPVETKDRNTRAVFGDEIDTYDLAQAVADNATVPIYYTARLPQLRFDDELKAVLDETVDDLLVEQDVPDQENTKSRWSRLEAVAGAPERLQRVATDIVEHFEARREAMGGGKAMVVAMSRRVCVALHDAIGKLRPEWVSGDDKQGLIKVVMTGSAGDPEEFRPHIRKKSQLEELARQFKKPETTFSLAIVRDMWLTGFDAPCLHTLYVDKPMRGHGLMQAIARVNRVFGEKPGGLVVDYLGIGAELKAALAAYSQGDRQRAGIDQDAAVRELLRALEAIVDLLN